MKYYDAYIERLSKKPIVNSKGMFAGPIIWAVLPILFFTSSPLGNIFFTSLKPISDPFSRFSMFGLLATPIIVIISIFVLFLGLKYLKYQFGKADIGNWTIKESNISAHLILRSFVIDFMYFFTYHIFGSNIGFAALYDSASDIGGIVFFTLRVPLYIFNLFYMLSLLPFWFKSVVCSYRGIVNKLDGNLMGKMGNCPEKLENKDRENLTELNDVLVNFERRIRSNEIKQLLLLCMIIVSSVTGFFVFQKIFRESSFNEVHQIVSSFKNRNIVNLVMNAPKIDDFNKIYESSKLIRDRLDEIRKKAIQEQESSYNDLDIVYDKVSDIIKFSQNKHSEHFPISENMNVALSEINVSVQQLIESLGGLPRTDWEAIFIRASILAVILFLGKILYNVFISYRDENINLENIYTVIQTTYNVTNPEFKNEINNMLRTMNNQGLSINEKENIDNPTDSILNILKKISKY